MPSRALQTEARTKIISGKRSCARNQPATKPRRHIATRTGLYNRQPAHTNISKIAKISDRHAKSRNQCNATRTRRDRDTRISNRHFLGCLAPPTATPRRISSPSERIPGLTKAARLRGDSQRATFHGESPHGRTISVRLLRRFLEVSWGRRLAWRLPTGLCRRYGAIPAGLPGLGADCPRLLRTLALCPCRSRLRG